MSTGVPAPRALLTTLLDGAAVFPPGSAPLARAAAEHRARARHPWADLVGPLLVPAVAAGDLSTLLFSRAETGQDPAREPLPVVLVARPGTTPEPLLEAADRLRSVPAVRLAGVELGHQPGWEQVLGSGLPVVVEVGRDSGPRGPVLEEVTAAAAGSRSVRVKLRTQSSTAGPVPTAEQVAGFLADARTAGLPVKLTGGLHHAVAGTVPVEGGGTEDQHGLLNVLLAAHRTVAGAPRAEVVSVLAERDGAAVARLAAGLSHDQAVAARRLLTSVGCCGVLDPLAELCGLGVLAPPGTGSATTGHDGPAPARQEEP